MRLAIIFYSLIILLLPLVTQARQVILPVEAIESSRYLSAEAFKTTFPGINIDGTLPDEPGWYIHYKHEFLSYFFGPIKQESDANIYKLSLEEIHKLVATKRPSLESGAIRLYRCSYDNLN